jgi:elongation factor 1-beta
MGTVAVTLKVMPESPTVDLEKIKSEIRKKIKNVRIKGIEEKPVAFGLKLLEILLILPDAKGGTDAIEEEIRSIKGVASVETGEVTLL